MTITTDASGRRSVQNDVEVHGTPEQVWQAIATGPGISSWFMPTTIEERDGTPVTMTSTFAPGMEARATITAWNPPHGFTALGDTWGGAPPVATEWFVEARAGGVCVVRVVSSLFASTDEWDAGLEMASAPWLGFFRTLRLYLQHFPGQRVAVMQLHAAVPGTEAEAWDALTSAFGLHDDVVGKRWTAPGGAPSVAGVVEYYTRNPYDALLRLDAGASGIAALGAYDMGGQAMVAANVYHYGDNAEAAVAESGAAWEAWFRARFPAPVESTDRA